MGTRFLPGEQTGLVAPVKGLSDLRCRKVFALFRNFLIRRTLGIPVRMGRIYLVHHGYFYLRSVATA